MKRWSCPSCRVVKRTPDHVIELSHDCPATGQLQEFERVERWNCGRCGSAGKSTAAIVYHPCRERHRPRRPRYRPIDERIHDARHDWARRKIGPAIEASLGEKALLDIDDE